MSSRSFVRDRLLAGIERPSRYAGGEFGLAPTRAAAPERLRVVLGFPDVYEVGMSHLGFRLLHARLLEEEGISVERVFLPWPDLQKRLVEQGVPLFTLESGAPIAAADLLGLSVQYELAYPAVLRLLDLARLPRRAAVRQASGQSSPLVLVGGAAALSPEPLAPFVDAFFLGEADEALLEIVEVCASARDRPTRERLERLAAVPGVYVPSLVRIEAEPGSAAIRELVAVPPATLPVVRRYVADLDRLEVPRRHLVPTCAPVHDRVTIELQRGCCQGCRFCQAGYVGRPTRQRSRARVLEAAGALLDATGYSEVGLLSLSAGDHPDLVGILGALAAEHGASRVAVSLPSLRTDSLSAGVVAESKRVRKTGFTLAPEAATDRLRRVINKRNTEEDLLSSVREVIGAGYSHVKLYFMIGLPTETDEDVLAIAGLAERLQSEAARIARSAYVTVSISAFVPKPHTPFQWEAALEEDELRRRLELLKRRVSRRIRLKWHDPGQSLVEAWLARADRRMASVLDRLVTPEHLGLDAWTERFDLAAWKRAFAEAHAAGEVPAPALLLGPRDPASRLPWDHLDVGVTKSYLERERLAALSEREREECVGGDCDACGVCPEQPLHVLAAPPAAAAAPPAVAEAPPAAGAAPEAGAPAPATILYRLSFRKEGRASALSHLETVSVFERAARRARLPLAFSSGYHPKPKMRFTPALPLGAESLCEILELGLVAPPPPEAVLAALAPELPEGLVLELALPATGDLLGRITGVRWRFHLPEDGAAAAEAAVEAARGVLASGVLELPRQRGGRAAASGIVEELRVDSPGVVEALCRFGPEGTLRPVEILEGLLGLDERAVLGTRIVRAAWTLAPPELP
jgi:radical SAM family uncharacterized protein/radical SAM-linked protein